MMSTDVVTNPESLAVGPKEVGKVDLSEHMIFPDLIDEFEPMKTLKVQIPTLYPQK